MLILLGARSYRNLSVGVKGSNKRWKETGWKIGATCLPVFKFHGTLSRSLEIQAGNLTSGLVSVRKQIISCIILAKILQFSLYLLEG